jgi:hypothetical protein
MMADEKTFKIKIDDGAVEPNSTLLALLWDGEKLKPGDARGTLADRLGAVFQRFMAAEMQAADYRRSAVKGKVVLTFNFTTGPDGSQTYTCEEKVTGAKIPPRSSMTFTDIDGELTSKPVEPLIDEMRRREQDEKNSGKAPAVGKASGL